MSLKALITVLVVGSSSVAVADTYLAPPRPAPAPLPAPVDEHKVLHDHSTGEYIIQHSQDHDREGRNQFGRWSRRAMLIASNVQLTNGFRDHRGQRPLFIDIDERMGGFSKLRFDLTAGYAYIDTVMVMLSNGTMRTYRVNQPLSYRSPSVTIDLDTRMITGMYVYGRSYRGYTGTFNVTGIRGWRDGMHGPYAY